MKKSKRYLFKVVSILLLCFVVGSILFLPASADGLVMDGQANNVPLRPSTALRAVSVRADIGGQSILFMFEVGAVLRGTEVEVEYSTARTAQESIGNGWVRWYEASVTNFTTVLSTDTNGRQYKIEEEFTFTIDEYRFGSSSPSQAPEEIITSVQYIVKDFTFYFDDNFIHPNDSRYKFPQSGSFMYGGVTVGGNTVNYVARETTQISYWNRKQFTTSENAYNFYTFDQLNRLYEVSRNQDIASSTNMVIATGYSTFTSSGWGNKYILYSSNVQQSSSFAPAPYAGVYARNRMTTVELPENGSNAETYISFTDWFCPMNTTGYNGDLPANTNVLYPQSTSDDYGFQLGDFLGGSVTAFFDAKILPTVTIGGIFWTVISVLCVISTAFVLAGK